MQVTIWNYLSESGFTNIDIYTNRLMWHLAFYEQHCEINNSHRIFDYMFQDFSSFIEMDIFCDVWCEYLSKFHWVDHWLFPLVILSPLQTSIFLFITSFFSFAWFFVNAYFYFILVNQIDLFEDKIDFNQIVKNSKKHDIFQDPFTKE